jgi:hypothetical protein
MLRWLVGRRLESYSLYTRKLTVGKSAMCLGWFYAPCRGGGWLLKREDKSHLREAE